MSSRPASVAIYRRHCMWLVGLMIVSRHCTIVPRSFLLRLLLKKLEYITLWLACDCLLWLGGDGQIDMLAWLSELLECIYLAKTGPA